MSSEQEPTSRLRVLIADDEPLGCKRLERVLPREPDVDIVGIVEDGASAIAAIRELRPQLVFLDVEMPRKNGVEIVRTIGPEQMPATIFVTAYDQYAIEAFELSAVDYLVKPFDDERFEKAFHRARRRIELEGLERVRADLLRLLQGGARSERPPDTAAGHRSTSYLERIAVQMKGRMRVVPVSSIDYITASGPYAELHVGAERHVIRESLNSLAEQLDPAQFQRIHRSAIVRLDLVESLVRGPTGDYEVFLRGGVRLRVGRSRRDQLQRLLGRI